MMYLGISCDTSERNKRKSFVYHFMRPNQIIIYFPQGIITDSKKQRTKVTFNQLSRLHPRVVKLVQDQCVHSNATKTWPLYSVSASVSLKNTQ